MTTLTRRTIYAVIPLVVLLCGTNPSISAQTQTEPTTIALQKVGDTQQVRDFVMPDQRSKYTLILGEAGILALYSGKMSARIQAKIFDAKHNLVGQWSPEKGELNQKIAAGQYTMVFSAQRRAIRRVEFLCYISLRAAR